jgi:hypothetical protein
MTEHELSKSTGGDLASIKDRQLLIDALTKVQTDDLVAAYIHGSSATELADLTGGTKQSVRGILLRNGVKMRPRGGDMTARTRPRPMWNTWRAATRRP